MDGAGFKDFSFSTSVLVIFTTSKVIQILKFVGVNFGTCRFADFNATWKSLEYCLKYGGNLISDEKALQAG